MVVGIFWVGSTEPRANLNSGNNGLSREQRGGRLTASAAHSLTTQTAQGCGLLGPLSPLLRCLFLFCQFCHNAAVGPAATGRVSFVCREDVTRLQERRATKWRTIVLSTQRDTGPDSQEDGIISASDKSLTGPKAAAVCERVCLSRAAYFTYQAAAEQPSDPRIRGRNAERLMSKSRQNGVRCDLNYSQSPARRPTKGAEHTIRTTHR